MSGFNFDRVKPTTEVMSYLSADSDSKKFAHKNERIQAPNGDFETLFRSELKKLEKPQEEET